MVLTPEQKERERKAIEVVEKARADLRDNPLEAIFPFGIPQNVLVGMSFTVTSLDYVNNIITFSIVS